VARKEKPEDLTVRDYQRHLFHALERPPRCGSNVNVMMKVMHHLAEKLSKKEKAVFLDSLEKYRNGLLPSSVNISILLFLLRKFKVKHLLKQTLFKPYPQELRGIEAMTAYCDGKDYWK
jgi:uncharacterized protein YbgA (DUF1722 family)